MARSRELQRDMSGQDTWRIFRMMAEFVDAFEQMAGVGKAVSIFGSARTKPSDPYYRAAEAVARELVRQKHAVITGGGPGIMEAGNKGAFEAGGTSVGLNITLPQEQEANRYQTISVDFHYFYARKVCFTKYSSAFICFPGGFGTLDEAFENLTLIQTLKIAPFPVVLYGSEFWGGLVDWMKKRLDPSFIDPEDLSIFRIVDKPADAVEQVVRGIKRPWWRPLDDMPAIADKAVRRQASGQTAEGTRVGRSPVPATGRHARPGRRPAQ